MSYCLDTSIAIRIIEGDSRCVHRLSALDEKSAFLPMIAWAELQAGARRITSGADAALAILERFAAAIPVLVFDEHAARAYGELFQRVPKRRNSFGRLIAAQALAIGATLVTTNGRDFADIGGLVIEDWTRP